MKKLEKLSRFNQLDSNQLVNIKGGNTIAESPTRQSQTTQHCTGDCYDTTVYESDDDGNSNPTTCTFINCI